MDIVLIVMSAFCILGLLDDFLGGKLKIAEDFQKGLQNMGRMCVCYAGFYCIGITMIANASGVIAKLSGVLPFDPALLIGCLICSDCGGLPIAQAMAATPALGIFTGALVGSSLGCSMGYQFPFFLSALDKKLIPTYLQGAVFGLATVPIGLIAGGLMLGLSAGELVANILPVAIVCLVMIIGFKRNMKLTLRVLLFVTRVILFVTYVLFALVIIGLFVPSLALAERSLVEEITCVVLRTVVVTCGGLVLANLVIRFCKRPLSVIAALLKINNEAVIGLLLSLFNGIAMLPLLGRMDKRGQIVNVAFSVCGAFSLGGQMAFVSSMVPSDAMPAYLVNKLLSGIVALFIARRFAVVRQEEPYLEP